MDMKQTVIVLAIIGSLLAAGCRSGPKPEGGIISSPIHEDDCLVVTNNINDDLLLFAGSVKNQILLGRVGGLESRSYDIAGIGQFPDGGVFILSAIPRKTYVAKEGSVSNEDILYTGLVLYGLKDTQKTTLVIPEKVDETMSAFIIASNSSQTACVLRLGTPDGPAIAALRPFEQNKKIWLKPELSGYTIYPAYYYLNNEDYSITSVQTEPVRIAPQGAGGAFVVYNFSGPDDKEAQIYLLFE